MGITSRLKQLKFPETLYGWRYGIQTATVVAVTGWVACIPDLNKRFFNGSARWIPSNAAGFISTSSATTTQRAILRGLGLGLCVAVLYFIVWLHLLMRDSDFPSALATVIIYVLLLLSALIYNIPAYLSPQLSMITMTAASKTPMVFGSVLWTVEPYKYLAMRALTVIVAIVASFLVASLILTSRSRVNIVASLSQILDHLESVIEPLFYLETGILEHDENINNWLKTNKKHIKHKTARFYAVRIWRERKEEIWHNLSRAGELINTQLSELKLLNYEITLTTEHHIDEKTYQLILINVRTLYYELCSIYFSLSRHIQAMYSEIQRSSRDFRLYMQLCERTLPARISSIAGLREKSIYSATVISWVESIISVINVYKLSLLINARNHESERYLRRAAETLEKFHNLCAEQQSIFTIAADSTCEQQMPEMSSLNAMGSTRYSRKIKNIDELSAVIFSNASPRVKQKFWEEFWLFNVRLATADSYMLSAFTSVRAISMHLNNFILSRSNALEAQKQRA